jgi:hypothetical protein
MVSLSREWLIRTEDAVAVAVVALYISVFVVACLRFTPLAVLQLSTTLASFEFVGRQGRVVSVVS